MSKIVVSHEIVNEPSTGQSFDVFIWQTGMQILPRFGYRMKDGMFWSFPMPDEVLKKRAQSYIRRTEERLNA